MKKWLILAAFTAAGALLLVVLIGSLLPRRHAVSRTVSLRQPSGTVWNLISGPPTWRPSVSSYRQLPDRNGHRTWQETNQHGQTLTLEAVEWTPQQRLVTRITDTNLPFGGTWTYDIAPAGSGCALTITEDGEVYNPLFRFVSRFIMGNTATIDTYAKELTAKLT